MQNSVKKRDLKKLYRPPPQQDYSSNYKRLVIVIVISFVFIAGEIVAGVISNSIAIISDAIHLISDLVGFLFSFLFLYLSKWPPNQKMTFGYHRMELLGAISNIFIIWILIFFVVYESTNRIIAKEFVKQPMIMLITAVGGLIVNIVMYQVLHNGSSHSHGLLTQGCSHDHGHQHKHAHKHQKNSNKESKKLKTESLTSQPNNFIVTQTSCLEDICNDDGCNDVIQVIHCHKNADIHKHSSARGSPVKLPPLKPRNDENLSQNQSVLPKVRQIIIKRKVEDFITVKNCEEDHEHSDLCFMSGKKNGAKHQHICNDSHEHHQPKKAESEEAAHVHTKNCQHQAKVEAQHQHNDKCSHSDTRNQTPAKQEHKHEGCGGHGHHDHGHHDHGLEGHEQGHHGHEGHDHGNGHNRGQEDGRLQSLGMQAAVLHALSDMIMSVGLIISGLIIFFLGNPGKPYNAICKEWNPWHLFDPISTYVFSIIAFTSTLPVAKNAYLLMMETTPSYINLAELHSKCEQVKGVIDVHDIHVWDLKPGKTCMSAHVLAKTGTERQVLVGLTDVARWNKIYHSTFQVEEEEWKHEDTYILCDHDIH